MSPRVTAISLGQCWREGGIADGPGRVGTAEVGQIIANVSALYSPELMVGYSPYVSAPSPNRFLCMSHELTAGGTLQPGGSDHQRFHEYGFPAAQVVDRAGVNKDPMYHDTGLCLLQCCRVFLCSQGCRHGRCAGDVSERDGYDFEQIRSIAKVQVCTVAPCIAQCSLLIAERDAACCGASCGRLQPVRGEAQARRW